MSGPAPSTAKAVRGHVALTCIEAILTTILNNPSQDNTFANSVYKVKKQAVDEYFGLRVGGQSISSQTLVRDISRGYLPQSDGVNLPGYLVENYWDMQRDKREQMANCLLLGIFFYKSLFGENS